MPRIGDSAPDFVADALLCGAPSRVHLAEYRGQWVVLFFIVGDYTCVCLTEIAAVAVKYPAFRELGTEILAVSVDPIATHRRLCEETLQSTIPGGARFPLISDGEGAIGRLFGVYDDEQRRHLRSHFVIDPDGVIQGVEMLGAPIGRSVSELLRQIRALKAYRDTGRFAPCGWEPGKPTLSDADVTDSPEKVWDIWRPGKAF